MHNGNTITALEALVTEVLRLGYHQHQCADCKVIYFCEHRAVCVPRSEQEAAELLCVECRDREDTGIPNVPAIIWEHEQRKARERLDEGLCPRHNRPIIETEQEEYCPECEAIRDGR